VIGAVRTVLHCSDTALGSEPILSLALLPKCAGARRCRLHRPLRIDCARCRRRHPAPPPPTLTPPPLRPAAARVTSATSGPPSLTPPRAWHRGVCDVRGVEAARLLRLSAASITPVSVRVPRAAALAAYFQARAPRARDACSGALLYARQSRGV
jgi:hypothetical protein